MPDLRELANMLELLEHLQGAINSLDEKLDRVKNTHDERISRLEAILNVNQQ